MYNILEYINSIEVSNINGSYYIIYKQNKFNLDDFQNHKFTRLEQIKRIINSGKVDNHLFWKKGAML